MTLQPQQTVGVVQGALYERYWGSPELKGGGGWGAQKLRPPTSDRHNVPIDSTINITTMVFRAPTTRWRHLLLMCNFSTGPTRIHFNWVRRKINASQHAIVANFSPSTLPHIATNSGGQPSTEQSACLHVTRGLGYYVST